VDAGHGGKDSGAIGLLGTLEKDVTLATALDLRRLLLATGRYRVMLTRSNDMATFPGKLVVYGLLSYNYVRPAAAVMTPPLKLLLDDDDGR
jgi:hypothetical protein